MPRPCNAHAAQGTAAHACQCQAVCNLCRAMQQAALDARLSRALQDSTASHTYCNACLGRMPSSHSSLPHPITCPLLTPPPLVPLGCGVCSRRRQALFLALRHPHFVAGLRWYGVRPPSPHFPCVPCAHAPMLPPPTHWSQGKNQRGTIHILHRRESEAGGEQRPITQVSQSMLLAWGQLQARRAAAAERCCDLVRANRQVLLVIRLSDNLQRRRVAGYSSHCCDDTAVVP